MKRAFSEDSRHFYRVKKFYFWPGRVQRSESRAKLLGLAKCWAGLELCRRRERVSVLGQAKGFAIDDEGSFSFPEELQLVALLQGILMRSIIIDNE